MSLTPASDTAYLQPAAPPGSIGEYARVARIDLEIACMRCYMRCQSSMYGLKINPTSLIGKRLTN